MKKYDWVLLDHKWNNFKRWFECMEQTKEEQPFVTMDSIRDMINFCDKTTKEIEDCILKAGLGKEK